MVFGSWVKEEGKDNTKEEIILVEETKKAPVSPFIAPTTTVTETVVTTQQTTPINEEPYGSPGRFDDLNREAKDITGTNECFDGLKADISKGLSERFQITHAIGLGSSAEPASYNFIGAFVGGYDAASGKPPALIMNGRVDTEGQLAGRVNYLLADKLTARLGGQVGNQPHSSQASLDLEYEGSNFHAAAKWVNPSTFGINYHQYITRRLSLGCDLFCKGDQGFSMNSYGFRYETGNSVTAGVFNGMQQAISYVQKVTKKVGLATELSFQPGQSGNIESLWTFGVEYRLRMSTFRAHIDSQGRVASLLEEAINPGAKFLLSADLDHKKAQYKFGMGMSVSF